MTHRKSHRRSVVIAAVAVTALSLAAGCAGGGSEAVHFVGGIPSGSASSGDSAPKPSPAKLTAACPLLSAADLKRLLGGSDSRTTVTATERKPDVSSGDTSYTCTYGSKGNDPFALIVTDIDSQDYTPDKAMDAIRKGVAVKTENVAGVGDAAVFYKLPDQVAILASAKKSQAGLRTVLFAAPTVVPKQKFVEVEKLVLGRL